MGIFGNLKLTAEKLVKEQASVKTDLDMAAINDIRRKSELEKPDMMNLESGEESVKCDARKTTGELQYGKLEDTEHMLKCSNVSEANEVEYVPMFHIASEKYGGTTGIVTVLKNKVTGEIKITVIIDSRLCFHNSSYVERYVICDISRKYRVVYGKIILAAIGDVDPWSEIFEFLKKSVKGFPDARHSNEANDNSELTIKGYRDLLEGFKGTLEGCCDIIITGFNEDKAEAHVLYYQHLNGKTVSQLHPIEKEVFISGTGLAEVRKSLMEEQALGPRSYRCAHARAMIYEPRTGGLATVLELTQTDTKPKIKRYSNMSCFIEFYDRMRAETLVLLLYDFKDKKLDESFFTEWVYSVVRPRKRPSCMLYSPLGVVGRTGLVLRCLNLMSCRVTQDLLSKIETMDNYDVGNGITMKTLIHRNVKFYVCETSSDLLIKIKPIMKFINEFELARDSGGMEVVDSPLPVVNSDSDGGVSEDETELPKLEKELFICKGVRRSFTVA